ncbi:MAG: hypothetical protein HFH24_12305 [Ruminococcus sp.]|nr:hypothetical protein [Ruminococcus sp.]
MKEKERLYQENNAGRKQWGYRIGMILYMISAAGLVLGSFRAGIFPLRYSLSLGMFLAVLGGILTVIERRRDAPVLAGSLAVFLTAGCLAGIFFMTRTVRMIEQVAERGRLESTEKAAQTAGRGAVPEKALEKDAEKVSEKMGEEKIENAPENMMQPEKDSFLVYLSGVDTYDGMEEEPRSDVNILAAVNTETKKILLISTPRDSYLEFSVTEGTKDKLTHAGVYGTDVSINALEQLYKVKVDYYLQMNFSGFVRIVDALGGIDVYSDYTFTTNENETFQQGYNWLTGERALAFARERYSFAEGDFQRAKNQMEIVRAVIQRAASPAMLLNYNAVMEAIEGSVTVSIPEDRVRELVKMQLSDHAQWEVEFYTVQGEGRYAETFSIPGEEVYVVDLDPTSIETARQKLMQYGFGQE